MKIRMVCHKIDDCGNWLVAVVNCNGRYYMWDRWNGIRPEDRPGNYITEERMRKTGFVPSFGRELPDWIKQLILDRYIRDVTYEYDTYCLQNDFISILKYEYKKIGGEYCTVPVAKAKMW